jgi:hypothetical protein
MGKRWGEEGEGEGEHEARGGQSKVTHQPMRVGFYTRTVLGTANTVQ